MQKEQEESIIKSIIYGNIVQNSYGMMRALCSAINNKDHIDKIILYLRNNQNFQKYNKFIYAFRLQQLSNDVFITQNSIPQREKFLEGYNDDTGLQGNGEKLLALLQKFNVRNVLVIIALRQKDPLKEFNAQHYVQIVKCAKELLSSLYDKVIMSKNEEIGEGEFQLSKEAIQTKEYVIPLKTFTKIERPKENPNYVGKQFIRKVELKTISEERQPQIKFLNQKIKELASILQDIIERFGENEDAQVKFAIRYDKSKRVVKVFNLFARLFDCKSKEDLLQNEMSTHLRSITSRNLTSETIKKLNEELMSDRSLRPEAIVKQNKICGILMEFLEVLLKSYAFAKKLAMIESQIEDEGEAEEQNEISVE